VHYNDAIAWRTVHAMQRNAKTTEHIHSIENTTQATQHLL